MTDYSDIVYNIDKLRLISQYAKDPNSLSPAGRKMAEDIMKRINGYNDRMLTGKQPINNQIQRFRLQNPAEIEFYKARQALIKAPDTPYLPDEVIPFQEAMDKVDLTKSTPRRPLGSLGKPANSIMKGMRGVAHLIPIVGAGLTAADIYQGLNQPVGAASVSQMSPEELQRIMNNAKNNSWGY